MKGRLALFIILVFYIAGIKALTMSPAEGLWELYMNRLPVMTMENLHVYVFYILYGFAALLALILFFGRKPKGGRLLFSLVMIALLALYGYEAYTIFGIGSTLGGSIQYTEVAFYGLGALFALYLLLKMQGREKRSEY